MLPVDELPKGSTELVKFLYTDVDLVAFLLQPLEIARIQHGVAVDQLKKQITLFVIDKDLKRSRKILKRSTATIDYSELSKAHMSLYFNN